MNIGNVEINGKLFLAPMCNVTAMPFRQLCKKYGAAMVYSEMIHADAYVRDSEKTGKRTHFHDVERPVGIQLTGSTVDLIEQAAKKAEKELKPDLIDINIGCPAYNVIKQGAGGALLDNPAKLKELVSRLSSAIKIPLTCKMRIKNDAAKTIEIAKSIEKAGAAALTVHGRTVKQKYTGTANWDIIREVKKNLDIPVILNGDIKDGASAKKALSETKCDAVMIGRAAIGNPMIFRKINYYLETGMMMEEPGMKEKIRDFLFFVDICRKYGYLDMVYIKMQAENFAKGFVGASEIRKKISEAKDIETIVAIISGL